MRALAFVWAAAAFAVAAVAANAHPSDADREEHRRVHTLCAVPEARLDPIALGSGVAELRTAFGDALVAQAQPQASQLRLRRSLEGSDVAWVEYDLDAGRVYRIRWRLAPRFEVPLSNEFAGRARVCLGDPAYDQQLEPRPSWAQAVVRRVGWQSEGARIELRQLDPLTGGAVYLSIAEADTLARLTASGGASAEPNRPDSWWRAPRAAHLPDAAERTELADAFSRLLAQLRAASAPAPESE